MNHKPNSKKLNSLSWHNRCQVKGDVSCHTLCDTVFSPVVALLNNAMVLFMAVLAYAAILAPASSRAALMAYEGFNYSSGSANLTGLNGGFGWKGAWQGVNNGSSSVQAGSLAAGANAPSGYDSLSVGNSAISPNNTRTGRFLDTTTGGSFGVKGYINGGGNIGASGKTIYISFMQQPNGTTSYYEFEFHRGNLGDPGRIGGIGNDSGANTSVYLRVPSAGQTAIGAGSTSVNFYVVRIDFLGGNDAVRVYQNPTSASEPATATLTNSAAGDMSFNGLSFGCFNNGRTVAHDEIRVGETWADVVSPGAYSAGNWDGGGTDNNWSTGGNWDNNVVPVFATSLTFAGGTRLNNTNDLTGVFANSITFDSAAGAFTLNGNNLGLNGNIAFNANPSASITQTINLPLTPSGSFTIDTRTNGNLTINGNIAGSGGTLTQTSTGNVGTLTLGGTNSFAGFIVNGGTNRITGATAIAGNGSSRFCLANANAALSGTLFIENSANLTVSGNFVDAAVIGRDGGKGTVIQNGGTFTFGPANNQLFLVGATGNSATRAEYDMNGGVFDLNNCKLGLGLGAGVLITGVVNQVGGVITNVGNLDLGTLTPNGKGIYNLSGGSIYIGSSGITTFNGIYVINLGGGTVGAYANWSSTLNMTLTGINGPVTFNPGGNTITLSGILSGSGGLTVNGLGVLDLSGANTYTGDTIVTAGSTLQFDTTGTSFGAVKLANGSTLNLNYSGTRVAAAAYTNGVALSIGTYNAGNLPGFITGSGNLQVASGISTGIWDGGGANNNWSTGGNWDQDSVPGFPIDLTFAGSTRLNNNNDLSSITVSSITFGNAAGAFTIGGNDITLSGSIGFNANPAVSITQTVNLGLTWTANQTLNLPTNGNLTLGGNISSAANNLTKTGAGTLTSGGVNSFAGYSVNGGTNIITGSTTVSGTGGRVYVADGVAVPGGQGAIVLQSGANFTFTGSYGDYLVIGRDSANGKVVQNGGTFDFNPSDGHNILLVAAGGGAHGYGEYDISGGVLDLHGNTLGAAWGDGGVVTGVVNQTGGAINNAFKLDVGVVKASGLGIYNLSGGSIAIDFGGITSDSGSYQINLGGGTISAISSWISTLNMTLTGSNGPVTFDTSGNTIVLSGTLSGPGGLNVAGGGILELAGATVYSGDTTVNSGFLQLDAIGSSAGAFRVVDGGLFNLNFTGNYVVAALYTNGVSLPIGTYNSGNLPSFISGSGNIQVVGVISLGIWDGGGADNNWNTGGNWDQNVAPIFPHDLYFGGSTRLNNNNDLTGITVTSMTFSNNAGAFTIGGNDITLSGAIGFNGNPAAPITQTVNLGMTWAANKTIDTPANGNLSLGGNITTAPNDLTKTGAGTLTLGGVDSFAGYAVNGGTNIITGNVTANGTGGSRFVLANANAAFNGTLVIQPGATFNVTGNWTDAGVIGRDAGKGTVTQNGGLFNFNMGNQPWLFVGASGFAGTTAAYNMNGGVLDMNGKQLGVALAVNGFTVTGVVNQASGVITNVSELRLGVVGGQQGNGKYNLTGGSIYIGATGITSDSGIYQVNLGGGTVGALASWSSTLNMTLTGINGPVLFDPAGNTIALPGILSGPGGLTVSGGGTLELSGADTYTGDTTVNAGILKLNLAGSSASVVRIATGAMLNLNYGGTITVPAGYTNGVALAGGVYTSANLPGFITGAGSLTVSAATPPVVNPPIISGGNLILTGGGGSAGAGYTWLSSTNLTTPMASWITNTTGTFNGSGNFSNAIPVSSSTPAQFFRLRTP
ncbi:MAG TPA: autotransporter-associated beta strand repeat-containing protein [Verrucomicrobiae bacterium]|nr:autotransporter-associated beta strand repeat-containing protein [Verrucomicrobiae bacterium]